MAKLNYTTPGGINVTRLTSVIPFKKGLGHLLNKLDRYRGIYLSSGYEYPERYSRWDVASICPPIEIVASGREIEFRPLNSRGEVLNRMLHRLLEGHPHWEHFGFEGAALHGRLKPLPKLFPEEERSKQPSAFSILRALIGEFQQRTGYQARAGGRVWLRSAVPVRSHRVETPAPRREGSAALSLRRHLLHGSQEGADRALSLRICAGRPDHRRTGANRCPGQTFAQAARQRNRERPPAGRVHGQSGNGARRHAPGRILRSGAAANLPGQLFRECVGAVPADSEGQSQPVRIFAATGRRAIDRRFAGDVRARGRASRGDLPHCRNRAAHRRSAARCR